MGIYAPAQVKSHRNGAALNAGLGMLQCVKLVSTGLAEWLKRIFMSWGKGQISKLFSGHVKTLDSWNLTLNHN